MSFGDDKTLKNSLVAQVTSAAGPPSGSTLLGGAAGPNPLTMPQFSATRPVKQGSMYGGTLLTSPQGTTYSNVAKPSLVTG